MYSRIVLLVIVLLISCAPKKKTQKSIAEIVDVPSPSKEGSVQPFLYTHNGKLLMSWTEVTELNESSLKFSEFNGSEWTKPTSIENGKDWFINWADFPSVIADSSNYIAHYLKKSDTATFAYDVIIKQSDDGGNNWYPGFKVHGDTTYTEHGFVTLLPYKKSFLVTWLDGRYTGSTMDHSHEHSGGGSMTLRSAFITPDGTKNYDLLLDGMTCDCCQTTATNTDLGPIIFYRNRTKNEIRDIYFTRFIEDHWTEPKPVYNDHWKINGCPVNGPKCDFREGTLAVAWFTAADNLAQVKVAFSEDNGTNFEKPITIDANDPMGRVDIELIDGNAALLSWMALHDTSAYLKVVKIHRDGSLENPLIISEVQNSRTTGFPQMEVMNDQVYFAWNQAEANQKTIKIVKIPLSNFKK